MQEVHALTLLSKKKNTTIIESERYLAEIIHADDFICKFLLAKVNFSSAGDAAHYFYDCDENGRRLHECVTVKGDLTCILCDLPKWDHHSTDSQMEAFVEFDDF